MRTPAVLIFDVGKTNKKILLFDEDYRVILEEVTQLPEIQDEDGDACEDVHALTKWITDSFDRVMSDERFYIRAVNVSAYGASFVHTDDKLVPVLPLYNYLKPYPQELLDAFYNTNGGKVTFPMKACSPVLGSLNSGMQVFRILRQKPEDFARIRYSLHLPQYLSAVLSKKPCSEITSIGCHTNLWDFSANDYHAWVKASDVQKKFPAIVRTDHVETSTLPVGAGIHDSSAALIPYLMSFNEPFILISTGTWCISLNPLNATPLTEEELANDCLCYLSFEGKAVKASRLFAGLEHDVQTKRIAEYFGTSEQTVTACECSEDEVAFLERSMPIVKLSEGFKFAKRSLAEFADHRAAYCAMIQDIVSMQIQSSKLVLRGGNVKDIFVDGGFSRNDLFMSLLSRAFPAQRVHAATVAQASALGAALVIHEKWNQRPKPANVVALR
jgi:sugar (pentulose or hexulose) kinase